MLQYKLETLEGLKRTGRYTKKKTALTFLKFQAQCRKMIYKA